MSELLEKILCDENIAEAQKRVYANKGAKGVDGVTVQDLSKYMDENWTRIAQEIRERKYKPQPVLRVEISKLNGGVRKLGIPTVVDRVIEQAMVQVLSSICEPHFSEYSYGFRPGRRCEQAILKLLEYFNDGYTWIVDIDLEKFFDNVPQDRLMSLVNNIIHDGDVESLIRKYLKAGVMVKGKYEETELGTPQGGNLSPLLSNIMLNELDRELEARGLRFTRYADDCVIVVGSEASAKRVMRTVTEWIERKLGLKVNATKTCVTKPGKLKYLGFGFWKGEGGWGARPHQDSIKRFKAKLKKLCKRRWSIDMDYRIRKLNEVIRGWINYFAIADMRKATHRLDEHLRVMMRVVIWKQWKVPSRREWGLRKLGVNQKDAHRFSYIKGYMKAVRTPAVRNAISKEILTRRGLVSIEDYYLKQNLRKRHILKLN
ncbi:MAG: group II intron reverse transcriptase/maturase [Oscillospiraceae bacterium]|nr:group II intron reverse transcriptase/maturase [Oscillospiraceae bacterium]